MSAYPISRSNVPSLPFKMDGFTSRLSQTNLSNEFTESHTVSTLSFASNDELQKFLTENIDHLSTTSLVYTMNKIASIFKEESLNQEGWQMRHSSLVNDELFFSYSLRQKVAIPAMNLESVKKNPSILFTQEIAFSFIIPNSKTQPLVLNLKNSPSASLQDNDTSSLENSCIQLIFDSTAGITHHLKKVQLSPINGQNIFQLQADTCSYETPSYEVYSYLNTVDTHKIYTKTLESPLDSSQDSKFEGGEFFPFKISQELKHLNVTKSSTIKSTPGYCSVTTTSICSETTLKTAKTIQEFFQDNLTDSKPHLQLKETIQKILEIFPESIFIFGYASPQHAPKANQSGLIVARWCFDQTRLNKDGAIQTKRIKIPPMYLNSKEIPEELLNTEIPGGTIHGSLECAITMKDESPTITFLAPKPFFREFKLGSEANPPSVSKNDPTLLHKSSITFNVQDAALTARLYKQYALMKLTFNEENITITHEKILEDGAVTKAKILEDGQKEKVAESETTTISNQLLTLYLKTLREKIVSKEDAAKLARFQSSSF